MNFSFNEEQEELRRSARTFLADHVSPDAVRAAMESDSGFDPNLWKRISTELGWASIIIPEEHGGIGMGYVELVALLEETGAALLCAPLFSTACLAAQALLSSGDSRQQSALLPGIASGESIATLALAEPDTGWEKTWTADGVAATAAREGDSFVLDGTKKYVTDGQLADLRDYLERGVHEECRRAGCQPGWLR